MVWSILRLPGRVLQAPVDGARTVDGRTRLTCAHVNAPGFLMRLNDTVARAGANIASQQLETKGDVGYSVADVEGELPADFVAQVDAIEGAVKTRLLGSDLA